MAVVTGGYGVLGGSMAEALGAAGARVVVLGRNHAAAAGEGRGLRSAGVAAMGLVADVLDEKATRQGAGGAPRRVGRVDILVNAAGGHVAGARTDHAPAFEMSLPAFEEVRPPQPPRHRLPDAGVRRGHGPAGEGQRREHLVDGGDARPHAASSATPWPRPPSRASPAGWRWTSRAASATGLRVNAIAPGFFVAKQNRAVLVQEDGSLTERGQDDPGPYADGAFRRPVRAAGGPCCGC